MCIQGFDGKTREKEPLGKPRHTHEDNIKIDLQEAGWEHGLDLSGSGYGGTHYSETLHTNFVLR